MTYPDPSSTDYYDPVVTHDNTTLTEGLSDSAHVSSAIMTANGYDIPRDPDYDPQASTLPLSISVEHAVRRYFSALEGEASSDLYDLILTQVEKPLLLVALEHSQGNQSKCASILGLNRGTLRKKLKAYNLIE